MRGSPEHEPDHRVDSTAAARRPTRCRTPGPTGIQTPPGSSLGPHTFLGRNPSFSNPDFVVPNVHQFSVGIQRELPWSISLDMTYAGSRSYDSGGGLQRLQRAVGGVPAAVRRDAGRQPQPSATSCCRTRSSACAASRARPASRTRRSRASS